MAYSDFDLKTALRAFELIEQSDRDLFAAIEPVEPSPYLVEWLADVGRVALGINTEKAKSESIIFPILTEAKRKAGPPVNILSGVALDVDRASGLTGFCDFLIARSEEFYYLEAPIISVVEAKKEDIITGFGQCAAELVAIRLFNEREQSSVPVLYGCVTSGNVWRFLKLDGTTLSIDRAEYYLPQVAKILGILVSFIRA